MRHLHVVAILAVAITCQPVHALWDRRMSIEWYTNVSDVVVIADVTQVKPIEAPNEYWDSQTVTCKPVEVLKGKSGKDVTFRQDFWHDRAEHGKPTSAGERPLQRGDKILFFLARASVPGSKDETFWINLTRPDIHRANHAAYDNDCNWLGDGQAILKLVKARIGKEDPKKPEKKRGLIVGFKDGDDEMYCDFVRTADPDFRPRLVELLRKGRGVEWAIYNLISYPSKETVELIRPFLKDPTKTTIQISRGKAQKVTEYPVRQMAYEALRLLGESPPKPEGYLDDNLPWLLQVGFEDPGYFPSGDWKRLEKKESGNQ